MYLHWGNPSPKPPGADGKRDCCYKKALSRDKDNVLS